MARTATHSELITQDSVSTPRHHIPGCHEEAMSNPSIPQNTALIREKMYEDTNLNFGREDEQSKTCALNMVNSPRNFLYKNFHVATFIFNIVVYITSYSI